MFACTRNLDTVEIYRGTSPPLLKGDDQESSVFIDSTFLQTGSKRPLPSKLFERFLNGP